MIQPDRITVAEHLFIGESLAPLLDEIEQALAASHPTLCAKVRQALTDTCPHCGMPADTTVCGVGGCPLGGDL